MLRFVLRLVIAVFAAVLAVTLLLVAVVAVAWVLVKALLTGKKPAPAMVFSRFRHASVQDLWKTQPSGEQRATRDVVDVVAKEVDGVEKVDNSGQPGDGGVIDRHGGDVRTTRDATASSNRSRAATRPSTDDVTDVPVKATAPRGE